MGDTGSFSYGKKQPQTAGLEFAGSGKKSRFAQYAPPVVPAAEVAQQVAAQQLAQPTAAAPKRSVQRRETTVGVQQYYANETPHEQVLYQPVLQQVITEEPHVLPVDSEAADLAFDVSDTLEDDNEFFADMPKSKIKRPQQHYEEEVKIKAKKGLKRSFAVIGFTAGIAILVVSWMLIQQYAPPVSTALRKKVGYPVYQLQPSNTYVVDRKSVQINENNSLVYKVKDEASGKDFVFSQQSVPDVVKEDQNYQEFLAQTDKYASFDSHLGKVYLTKPQGIGSDVSVVLKSDNTLLFIRGSGDTPEKTWTDLVARLKMQ